MFREVAEAGGFAPAARGTNKSQSAIHHAVQKLEAQLGLELFRASGRRIELTDAGRFMLQRARYVLDEAERLESAALTLAAGVETHLVIAADEIFPPALLFEATAAVSAAYPQLRMEIHETVLSGANELLQAGRADVAITPFPVPGGMKEEICRVAFRAMAHPDHPLHAEPDPISLEVLKSHRQIVVRDSAVQVSQDAGWLGADQRWTVSHTVTSIDLVARGYGFAWLPTGFTRELEQRGQLRPLNLQRGARRTESLYLGFRDADALGPATIAFVGELRDRVAAG